VGRGLASCALCGISCFCDNAGLTEKIRRLAMKKIIISAIISFSMLISSGAAVAQTGAWQIDKAHSNIYFDIRHTFASVRGQFDDFTGTVNFDPDSIKEGHVEFRVLLKDK
jgi:polyisoprenoid-binding protein YceI